VLSAIESDPSRAAQAIEASLNPSPDDIKTSLDSLCSSLRLAPALQNEVLNC
jgi:hypothetical protein